MTHNEEALIEALQFMIHKFKDMAVTKDEKKAIAVADCAIGMTRVNQSIANVEVQPWGLMWPV